MANLFYIYESRNAIGQKQSRFGLYYDIGRGALQNRYAQALAEAAFGKGRIVLFAFRPQHRGQTFGTFPFIFNALEK